jgi:hypothetical protein
MSRGGQQRAPHLHTAVGWAGRLLEIGGSQHLQMTMLLLARQNPGDFFDRDRPDPGTRARLLLVFHARSQP